MARGMRGPQFHDFSHSNGHFDPDASPRYLMVREGDSALVLVVNDDLVAKPRNEHVASVENKHLAAGGRVWRILGNKPPTTYIELFSADGKRWPERLEVDVKSKMSLTVAFAYVTQDGRFDKTTRDPNMPDVLLQELNDIYTKQTNIVFNEDPATGAITPRSKDIQISTSLFDIVLEKEHGPRDRRKPRQEWDTLVAQGDPTADINVFFMPHNSGGNMRGFDRKAFVKDGDAVCVFPDGMSDDEVRTALPHWVGIFRGCKDIANVKQQHHLMFWTRADGQGIDVGRSAGKIPFIPRDCVRAMNP